MRLLSFGLKLPVAVQLEWQLPREPKEIKDAPRRFATKFYGRIDGEDGDVALGEDTGVGDRGRKAYCGAALIALAAPDAFVFHELPVEGDEAPTAWICGVRGGLPLPGFDAILPISEARTRYNEFLSFNSAAQVYGSLSEAREAVADLVGRLDAKQLKRALLLKHGISLVTVASAIGIPLLVSAAVVGYLKFEEVRARDRLTHQQMIEREMASAKQRERIAELRAGFESQVAAKRLELELMPEPMHSVDGWVRLLSTKVPISFAGYAPLSANCKRTECTVRWRPSPQALPIHMLELPGKPESTELAAPSTALVVAPVPTSTRKKVGGHFKLELLSFAKSSASTVTVVIREDAKPVRVVPHKDLEPLGLAPVLVGTVGRFQASFTNLVALREFARWVQPYAVALERLEAVAFAPNVGTPAYHVEGVFLVEDQTP